MEEKQMAKELFFSVIIRTENMYGTGGVMFSANKFKGFIANDYLEGSYNEENGLLRFDLLRVLEQQMNCLKILNMFSSLLW